MLIRWSFAHITQPNVRHLFCQVFLRHALHGLELLPIWLSLDVVLVHGARPVDNDLEPFGACLVLRGIGERGGRVEGHGRLGCGLGRGHGCGEGAGGEGRGSQYLVDAIFGGCHGIGGGFRVPVCIVFFAFVLRSGSVVAAGVGDELFQGEADGRGVERSLGRIGVAVDGKDDVVGGVVVLVLQTLVHAELTKALQHTEDFTTL